MYFPMAIDSFLYHKQKINTLYLAFLQLDMMWNWYGQDFVKNHIYTHDASFSSEDKFWSLSAQLKNAFPKVFFIHFSTIYSDKRLEN